MCVVALESTLIRNYVVKHNCYYFFYCLICHLLIEKVNQNIILDLSYLDKLITY